MIDLSLVFVTWNIREPALTRIEYHRSPYRFFRKNGGCGRMAIVLVLRIAKSLFYLMSQVPPARAEARR